VMAGAVALKLAWEITFLARGGGRSEDLRRSARLLRGPELGGLTRWRFGLGLVGGMVLPLAVAALCDSADPPLGLAAALAGGAVALVVAAELCERVSFFAAVTSPSMPRELP
jgi:hypothetical protein